MKLVEISTRVIVSDDDYALMPLEDIKEGYRQYTYGTAFAIHDIELKEIEEGVFVQEDDHIHDKSYCDFCVKRGTNEI